MQLAGTPVLQHVVVVDADPELRRAVASAVLDVLATPRLVEAGSGRAALAALRAHEARLLIVDMGSIADLASTPVAALTRLVRQCTGARVLALSEGGAVSTALAALEAGAHDHAPRGADGAELAARLRALCQRHGGVRLADGPVPGAASPAFEGMVGQSSQMQVVFEQVLRAAAADGPVFIAGEAGTGKDLCAEAVHRRSPRAAAPFVKLGCADFAPGRLEALLFGADAAASSDGGTRGALARAAGGTIYLDEIAGLDLSVQARLLRLLQAGRYARLGDAAERASDVRLICATALNPVQLIAERRLREDLFYRLHVLPIHLPPLRQRQGDIGLLARHFVAQFAAEERRAIDGLSEDGLAILVGAEWPGNVRALQRLMQRAVVMHEAGPLSAEALHRADLEGLLASRQAPVAGLRNSPILPMWQQEQRIIEEAIASFGGNVTLAAQALELSPSTIYRKRQAWAEIAAGRKGAA